MPTARGWGVLAAMVAAYGGAWTLHYVELSVIGTGCLVALVAGALYVVPHVSLDARRSVAPTQVSKGSAALGVIIVRRTGGGLGIRSLSAVDHCAGTSVVVDLGRLRRGEARTRSYPISTGARGLLNVGPLRISQVDPLGLFGRTRRYGQVITLLVRPRTVDLLVAPAGRSGRLDGTADRPVPGGLASLHGLREYAYGDDLRHIHWRTSARTATLMVRQWVDVSRPSGIVVLDNRPGRYRDADEFEIAVDVTASLLLASVRRRFPVELRTCDGPAFTAAQTHEAGALLDRLAVIECGGRQSLAATTAGAVAGSLTVVTGSAAATEWDILGAAGRRVDEAILVRVGGGAGPPPGLGLKVIDATDLDGFGAAWSTAVPA